MDQKHHLHIVRLEQYFIIQKYLSMELPIDQEDFDNEIFKTINSNKSQDEKRYCPHIIYAPVRNPTLGL